MKKIAILLMSVILLTSLFGISSFAALPTDSTVQPLWDNAQEVKPTFIFNESCEGLADIQVLGKSDVDKIECEIVVSRKAGSAWYPVDTGSTVVNGQSLYLSVPVTGTVGTYYKAEFTVKVYVGDVCETITYTKNAVCMQPYALQSFAM